VNRTERNRLTCCPLDTGIAMGSKGLKYPKWFKNRSTFEYDPLNSVVEFSTALRFENTQNLLL